jgi:hypothetical protein
VFHDNIWDKAYPWLGEVADAIDVCLYTNRSIWADSAQRFPRGVFVYTPQLLDTSRAGLYRETKEDKVIWLPQWKAWKGIKEFVQALPNIRWPVDLYNSGIEYHYLRKEPIWKKAIGKDEWTKRPVEVSGRGDHVVRGPAFPAEVRRALSRSNVSVDLTGFKPGPFSGQTTYVHFESMVYGAVNVLSESVLERPSPIPVDCAIPWDPTTGYRGLASVVNGIMGKPKEQRRIARRALSFVTDRFDDGAIAAGILALLDSKLPQSDTVVRIKLPKLTESL